jgi:hypothetical protein
MMSGILLLLCGGAVVVILIVAVVAAFGLRRREPERAAEPDLAIDLAQLDAAGPPKSGVVLECYGVPVRLAILVLAPVGRGEFPTGDDLIEVLEGIVPGLNDVFATHGTSVRRWPPQMSPRGFSFFFSSKVKLPGDRGKGSPWCSISGKTEHGSQSLLVGMALCADAPNALGHFVIERDNGWLEALRVKR